MGEYRLLSFYILFIFGMILLVGQFARDMLTYGILPVEKKVVEISPEVKEILEKPEKIGLVAGKEFERPIAENYTLIPNCTECVGRNYVWRFDMGKGWCQSDDRWCGWPDYFRLVFTRTKCAKVVSECPFGEKSFWDYRLKK